MTTQAMYDNGLRCKGKGFNCRGCHNANNCVEYIDVNFKFPPVGVVPKYLWDLQRMNNLKGAIDRYIKDNLAIPTEWIEEYNELQGKLYEKLNYSEEFLKNTKEKL